MPGFAIRNRERERLGRAPVRTGFALWLSATLTFVAMAGFAAAYSRFPFDRRLTLQLQQSDSSVVLTIEEVADFLGSVGVVVTLTAAVWLLCLAYRQRALLAAATSVLPLYVLGLLLKLLVDRPRPATDAVNVRNSPPGLSFPSAHALAAALLCTLILIVAARITSGWKRYTVSAVALVYAAVVGAERVYDGVHWSSDVMGGYLLGAVLMVATVRIFDVLLARRTADDVTRVTSRDIH